MIDIDSYKCGFVAIIGKPNVGKSTLMNHLIGQKLSIISPKPQTTRQNLKGILSDDKKQIIFVDTPGFLKSRYELHDRMLDYIRNSLRDSDLIVFITDANKFPTDYDRELLEELRKVRLPKIALLNKIDLIDKEIVAEKVARLKDDFDTVIPISALHGEYTGDLADTFAEMLPFSPPLYDPENLSDLPMRFFAQEMIREKIFLNFDDEIPYATAVLIDRYNETDEKVEIDASIWIERDSQKPIIIGKGGQKIKKVRISAQRDLKKFVGKPVKMELFVKIKKNWRKKTSSLNELGFKNYRKK
ncbi:MAG: GTPase Era [Candidatus Cloacimonetes bacterium 4572_65]|nr:MAG: GTPase Era [Candidatus Cloacimonetes bacterium 4572_65]